MPDETQLAAYQQETALDAYSVQTMRQQVAIIQNMMRGVMKEGEHYGKVPGCGDKPTLLKSGAEKISFSFKLMPRYEVTQEDLGDGHRGYQVICTLVHAPSQTIMGQGVGYCSTMESKYRYRSQGTGRPVPKEYWDTRDPAILGGDRYHPKKVDGEWMIFERIEHDNPADYHNTALKIGKKRAHVDAVLTTTAASDIFTQDIEDMGVGKVQAGGKPKSSKPKSSKPNVETPKAKTNGGTGTISEAQQKRLYAKCKASDIDPEIVKMAVRKKFNDPDAGFHSIRKGEMYDNLCSLVDTKWDGFEQFVPTEDLPNDGQIGREPGMDDITDEPMDYSNEDLPFS